MTIWKRITTAVDGLLSVSHNHTEEGHVAGIKPKPLCDSEAQRAWAKYDWMKSFGWEKIWKVKLNPLFPGTNIGEIIS